MSNGSYDESEPSSLVLASAGLLQLWMHAAPLSTPSRKHHAPPQPLLPSTPPRPCRGALQEGEFQARVHYTAAPLVLISFDRHTPTRGKIRAVFQLLLSADPVPTLKRIRGVPPGDGSLTAPRSCGRARWPVQKPLAGAHLCRGAWRTVAGSRLPPNAAPSRYLNHVKAFLYYIPPCDFAWPHSNYQPCCMQHMRVPHFAPPPVLREMTYFAQSV